MNTIKTSGCVNNISKMKIMWTLSKHMALLTIYLKENNVNTIITSECVYNISKKKTMWTLSKDLAVLTIYLLKKECEHCQNI